MSVFKTPEELAIAQQFIGVWETKDKSTTTQKSNITLAVDPSIGVMTLKLVGLSPEAAARAAQSAGVTPEAFMAPGGNFEKLKKWFSPTISVCKDGNTKYLQVKGNGMTTSYGGRLDFKYVDADTMIVTYKTQAMKVPLFDGEEVVRAKTAVQ